ncbi:MAG: alpha-N-acetylglucosaminidase TIM-barrel domain-containing protein [Candidatus Latescibacterota bacterium]
MGNDHAHGGGCPCAESRSGQKVYDLIRLKMHTHLMTERMVQQVDPGALWVLDTWDYGCEGAWKNEEVRALLRTLGKGNYLALDIWADDNTRESYRDWGFFEDHDWGIGLLHGFAGEDEIAGDREFILERTQAVLRDPRARRCIAFAYLDEKNHDDTMYAQLLARLAWHPQDLTLEGFLQDYALRRYGRPAAAQMAQSMASLCEGVKHTQRQDCWYQWTTYIPAHRSFYDHLYGGALFGTEQEAPVRKTVERVAQSAPHLLDCLGRALEMQEVVADQGMYETDLVDIARTLLADLVSLELGRAFLSYLEATRGFARGDSSAAAVAAFEGAAAHAEALVLSLEMLLSTREDFSLARSIAEVLEVPGVNSWSDTALRQRAENPYNRSHVFELVHRVYRRDVATYVALLRRHLGERDPVPVSVKDEGFRRALNEHGRGFYQGELEVPRTYRGTALEAAGETYQLAREVLAA